jgi:CubicO group peptidase (beta-lactamase class C family)
LSQADLSNWRVSPYSRWAFHNVEKIIPVAVVKAGGDPMPLPSTPRDLSGFEVKSRGTAYDLKQMLTATASDGIVVLHDGKIVFEDYAHGTTADTQHIIMSATKSITGLLAGMLKAHGLLDTDALVSDYVGEVTLTAYQGATIRQLLDMRAGVHFDERGLREYALATGWDPAEPGEQLGDLHSFYCAMKARPHPHGGPFAYVSANTDLLGWAIERAAEKPFAVLLSELLWKPMGATHDAWITVDPKGAPRCTGGLCMTVRDFARIGNVIANDGKRGDTEIVPLGWIEDIASNGDRAAWKAGEFAQGFAGMDMTYRNSWYVDNDTPQVLFAMGIHGQNLFIDRANRIVIAKVSSQAQPVDYAALPLIHRGVTEFQRLLGAKA